MVKRQRRAILKSIATPYTRFAVAQIYGESLVLAYPITYVRCVRHVRCLFLRCVALLPNPHSRYTKSPNRCQHVIPHFCEWPEKWHGSGWFCGTFFFQISLGGCPAALLAGQKGRAPVHFFLELVGRSRQPSSTPLGPFLPRPDAPRETFFGRWSFFWATEKRNGSGVF